MRKLLFLLILVGILSISSVKSISAGYAQSSTGYTTDVASFRATFVSQNPYPAEPDGYVNLVFKLENWGTDTAQNVIFELLPEYPFSLDPGVNATQQLGTIAGAQTGNNGYLVKYKVKVGKDALSDDNEITVRYTHDNGAFFLKTFNVTVSNPRTDFDVVVQDSTSGSTTLAIANIGANTASSVIVSIPNQQNYVVTGVSASVLGNLNGGDYTLVSFQITSRGFNTTSNQAAPTGRFGNSSAFRNASGTGAGNLLVEISYTDTLGIRRTVQKEVSFAAFGATGVGITGRATQGIQSQTLSGGLTYIVIGVGGIVVVVAFFKLRKRRKK